MNQQPQIVTGVFCINPSNEICLIRSTKNSEYLTIPGGKLEWQERLEDCVRREMKEETGTEISDLRFLSWSEHYTGQSHRIFFNYACRTLNPRRVPQDSLEIVEVVWLPFEAAKNDPRVLPRLRDELHFLF